MIDIDDLEAKRAAATYPGKRSRSDFPTFSRADAEWAEAAVNAAPELLAELKGLREVVANDHPQSAVLGTRIVQAEAERDRLRTEVRDLLIDVEAAETQEDYERKRAEQAEAERDKWIAADERDCQALRDAVAKAKELRDQNAELRKQARAALADEGWDKAMCDEYIAREHADLIAEVEHWRSGRRRKSWPVIKSVPDGVKYAALLARAQGTEGGDDHDRLLREAAQRLKALSDVAGVLLAERDRLRAAVSALGGELPGPVEGDNDYARAALAGDDA